MFIPGKTNKSSAFNIFMKMAVLTIKSLALLHRAYSIIHEVIKESHIHICICKQCHCNSALCHFILLFELFEKGEKRLEEGWEPFKVCFFNLSVILDLGACHQPEPLKKVQLRNSDVALSAPEKKTFVAVICHISCVNSEIRSFVKYLKYGSLN